MAEHVFPKVTRHGERYTIDNDRLLGRGAYSEVYLGRTAAGRNVAVKTACKQTEIDAIRNEVDILQKLRGAANIVQCLGSMSVKMAPGSVPQETLSFAMEFAQSSLETEMRRPENARGLPADKLIDLVVDCSMALSALHSKNIAHRDIKHMNILLFPGTPTRGRRSNILYKLCDMGCSRELLEENSHEMRTLVGTPNLVHPRLAKEVINPGLHRWKTQQSYTPEQCDLWSLGCTLYFCATGKLPFDCENNNKELYYRAVTALVQNPDAIGMSPRVTGRHAGRRELLYEFDPITVLPSKNTRYPKWLICTMTCLIRQFFHDPSITTYAEIANAMRTAKRRKFLSIDQLGIVDHSDMSDVPYVGYSIPSLSVCMGYSEKIDILLISNTTTHFVDGKKKSLKGLHDDLYLVIPQQNEVNIRRILARNIKFDEQEDMSDKKLADQRRGKCYEGSSMMDEADEYCELFEKVAKILSTQFALLVEELSHFERVQITSRFAVYMDMATVPMVLLDATSSPTKKVAEQCIQQAKQAREELEWHMKVAMDIEEKAKQLAKDSDDLLIEDVDLPGIRQELEGYFFYSKDDILATRDYSQELIVKCFNRRKVVMEQIFKSPDNIKTPKMKKALNLASSLNKLRTEYHKLQNTISECIDLLERPFQEMKEIVNRHLQQQGTSRNTMERSMHFLAPEFRKDQQRVKAASQTSKGLVDRLNEELEQTIKELGFVRMGDTLVAANKDEEQRTLVQEKKEETREEKTVPAVLYPAQPPSAEPCCAQENIGDISFESSSGTYTTSFESTPPSSPNGNGSNYFQAVLQYFSKPPPSSPQL